MSGIGKIEILVSESAIDLNGHVNNVHYIQWMQNAALAHSASVGWPTEHYTEIGRGWFIRSHSIEYLHPAYNQETIVVYTWVVNMQKVRCLRKFKFYRPADEAVLATATTLFIFCDLRNGKPISIPTEVQQAYPIITPEQEP